MGAKVVQFGRITKGKQKKNPSALHSGEVAKNLKYLMNMVKTYHPSSTPSMMVPESPGVSPGAPGVSPELPELPESPGLPELSLALVPVELPGFFPLLM